MPFIQKNGYWLCDEFERMYELVRDYVPFIYTSRRFRENSYMAFDGKELSRDKWRLRKWFVRDGIMFLDPRICYNPEHHRLLPIQDYWQAYYSIFPTERFNGIKDALKTALLTLTDTGYMTREDVIRKYKEAQGRGISYYYGKRKRQSSLSGALFGGKGREEEYGNHPFLDYASGLVHKTAGEKHIYERNPCSRRGIRQRVPCEPGDVSGRGPEVLSPCFGS